MQRERAKARRAEPGVGVRLLASYLDRNLKEKAALRVVDCNGAVRLVGTGEPTFEIKLEDPRVAWELLLNPSLAFGEAYMDKRVTVVGGDIFEFLDLIVSTMLDKRWTGLAWRETLRRYGRFLSKLNFRPQSRRNVEYHYDDKSELWDMFLDSYRQYTCGYFPPGVNSIDDAQYRKMDHIAKKLLLKPGQHVLDIGSGWGGLAVHLARNYGVRVDGVTLSQDQLAFAQSYAQENGVGDVVNFRLQDYRTLDQPYDRIVAVGMLEHVGVDFYQTYFDTIRRNLKKAGVALIHAIGRPSPPGANEPFMNKYIFPGTHAPALSELVKPIERSRLFLTDLEIWRVHYAHTLRAWRDKFYENWERALELYGEKFCRMWEYYLASCEVAFKRGMLQVFQMQLAKQFAEVPITRAYQYETEAAAR